MHVLLPDNRHFHRRNFAPLFAHLKAANIPYTRLRSRRRWWKRHGDYRAFAQRLAPHLRILESLDPAALLDHRHHGIRVMDCARSELLCLLLSRPHWYNGMGSNDAAHVLSRAWENTEDRRDLLLCLAAACDWLDHWSRTLDQLTPTHICVFSGSYIYTRTLQALADARGLRAFALESFFTGNDFYFEERTTPLPNRSQLRQPEHRSAIPLPADDIALHDRLRAEMHRRLRLMRNKNVRQKGPAPLVPAPFPPRSKPVVLIIGQVLNDFSLIETPLAEGSSLAIYRRLIHGLLERTDAHIIFKAHPWERRRPNLRAPLTRNAIQALADSLPAPLRNRLHVEEKAPITGLFPHVDHVVGLCSQGLLEACQAGLKPAQIGDAAFGNGGFTHDLPDADSFVDALAGGHLDGTLSLEDYRAFEDFMVRALVLHLLPQGMEGEAKIARRLSTPQANATVEEVLPSLTLPAKERAPLHLWLAEGLRHPSHWVRLAPDALKRLLTPGPS